MAGFSTGRALDGAAGVVGACAGLEGLDAATGGALVIAAFCGAEVTGSALIFVAGFPAALAGDALPAETADLMADADAFGAFSASMTTGLGATGLVTTPALTGAEVLTAGALAAGAFATAALARTPAARSHHGLAGSGA